MVIFTTTSVFRNIHSTSKDIWWQRQLRKNIIMEANYQNYIKEILTPPLTNPPLLTFDTVPYRILFGDCWMHQKRANHKRRWWDHLPNVIVSEMSRKISSHWSDGGALSDPYDVTMVIVSYAARVMRYITIYKGYWNPRYISIYPNLIQISDFILTTANTREICSCTILYKYMYR